MIHVVATIDLNPGKRNAFLREFTAILSTVRAEKGCIEYGPAVDLPTSILGQPPLRQDTVTIIEKWADLASLDAHLESPCMVEFLGRVKGMLADVRLQVLQPV